MSPPRVQALTLAALLLAGCTTGAGGPAPGVADLAGEWRGRWIGPSGYALAALSIEAGGAYRARMFLDGGDRDSRGVILALPSGRLRYQGAEGNGDVRVEASGGVATLRLVPDGGGGGGTFRRPPGRSTPRGCRRRSRRPSDQWPCRKGSRTRRRKPLIVASAPGTARTDENQNIGREAAMIDTDAHTMAICSSTSA